MGTGVRIGAAVAAAGVLGVFLWKADSREDLAVPRGGLEQRELGAPRSVSEGSDEVAEALEVAAAREASHRQSQPLLAQATSSTLDVHVTWRRSGLPASDLELSFLLWEQPAGGRKRRGRTDGNGDFRLGGLAAGRVSVSTSFGSGQTVQVLRGETTAVEIALAEGFRARGRVVDSEGRGVAGARLWLSEYFNYENGFIVGETRSDGSFDLSEVPDARYLGAMADGFAPSHLHLLSEIQVEGADSRDVELELVLSGPGGSLQVSVVDASGKPVAEAWVRATGWVAPLDQGNGRSLQSIPTHDAWTDAMGRVDLRGLAPGSPELRVLARGMAPWKGSAQVSAGDSGTLRVQLAPECVVFGEMHTTDGEPAVGARVALAADYDPMMPMTRVDESGHYELRGLPAGPVELRAADRTLGSVTTSLVLTPEQPLRWDGLLDAGRVVAGRVLDDADQPLVGWTVQALLGLQDPWRVQVQSDEEGRFRLIDCRPGTLKVQLFRDLRNERVPTLVREVRDGDSSELLLRVGPADLCDGSLRARFLSRGGTPLPQVYVALWQPGADSGSGFESDAQGRLEISGLRSGIYQLTVSQREGPGFYLGEFQLAAAEDRDLGELRLPGLTRLHIVVTGDSPEDGSPYRFLSVSQRDPLGGASIRPVTSVRQEELADPLELYPGDYIANASGGDGVATEVVDFTIEPGALEQILELHPRPGRSCEVGVEIPEDADLPSNVRLLLQDGQGARVASGQLMRSWERRYLIHVQLAEGGYTLVAETSDGRSVRHSFEVTLPKTGVDASRLEAVVPLR